MVVTNASSAAGPVQAESVQKVRFSGWASRL
jgi:hypothetical protein